MTGGYGGTGRWAGKVLLAAVLLLGGGCWGQRATKGLELQAEDYRTARKQFQTQLVRRGHSPQRGQNLHPPHGARQIEYDAKLHLEAWVTPQPRAGQKPMPKHPAVLFLHGGFAMGADDWEMTAPYQAAGYVVMVPALRSENGQGGTFSLFYDEVADVLAAAEYLAKRPDVDAKHLYLAGHSVGGTLTLLAAMTGSRFRAAASFSGAPDVIEWSRRQQALIVFDPNHKREFQMRSAMAYATSFKCPVRICYGSMESLFGPMSRETAARAKKKGLDVEAVEVKGDHFSAVPEEIKRSLAFFKSK